MKRSEMIKVMKDAYEEFCKPFKEVGYEMPKLQAAELGFILYKMEMAGILPPADKSNPEYYEENYLLNKWDGE